MISYKYHLKDLNSFPKNGKLSNIEVTNIKKFELISNQSDQVDCDSIKSDKLVASGSNIEIRKDLDQPIIFESSDRGKNSVLRIKNSTSQPLNNRKMCSNKKIILAVQKKFFLGFAPKMGYFLFFWSEHEKNFFLFFKYNIRK